MTLSDIVMVLPIAFILVWAVVLLLLDLWLPRERRGWLALLTALGLAVGLGLDLAQSGRGGQAFHEMIVLDNFAVYLNALYLVSGLIALALGYDYLKRMEIERGEFYAMLLFSIAGMMLLTQANHLILVFLALEFL
ncbi:MAG: hypothetical protein ACPLTO_11805, partial [Thermanaerothrix sp.]